ncbi:MAG: endonuclease/exonuclease/phosphatase family protein [Bacteroidetes bacterium]|nr:endonuclease/exonuclease/phosphatase family protein [Bacteroidota bacterium]
MPRILLFSFLLFIFSCKKDPPVGDPKHAYFKNSYYNEYHDSSLVVLTYNIQLGFRNGQDPWDKTQHGGSPQQIHDIAEIIRRSNADIVLLQEVPINRSNVETEHFIEALSDSLDMNFAYGGHGKNDAHGVWPVRGVWGNAILSKYPVKEMENVEVFFKGFLDKRSVVRAEIRLNALRSLNVYCLHHSLNKDYSEMKRTREFADYSRLPFILGGDFNRLYGHSDYALLSDLQDILGSSRPGIDRIYSSLHDTVYQQGFVVGSNTVSDHGAFWCRLRFN